MALFYEKRVSPEFADTSAALKAAHALMGGALQAIEQFQKNQEEDRKRLLLSQYQNAATKAAVEAFQANPSDFDAYDRDFASKLKQLAPRTPLSEAGTYGAIANSVRQNYYWTIAANKEQAQKSAMRESLAEQFQRRLDAGMGLMRGQLQDIDLVTAVRDNLLEATRMLTEISADGTPVFSLEEQSEKLATVNYDVLTTQRDREINEDMSLEEVAKIVDPNFNYTVAIGDGNENSMAFQKNDLSTGMRRRLCPTTR
jgi:hypothetical protein